MLLALGTVAVCVVVLLLAELAARLFAPDALALRPEAGLALLHRYSEVYGWELRPGAHALVDGHPTRVNALGQRGVAHAFARTGGRPRVVVLGDSVAFGYGVDDGQTFADRLERDGFDVVNLSVPGYGTDQELLRLQREGRRFAPEVVLLDVCLENDFVDNVSRRFFYDDLHPKPWFEPRGDALVLHQEQLHLSARARLGLWLREHSSLLNWLRPRALPEGREWQQRKAAVLGDEAAALSLSRRLVEAVGAEAQEEGAHFVLVLHPNREAFQHEVAGAAALRRAALPRGAAVVDLAAAYRSRGLHFRDLTLESVGHLNPRGHEVTAAILEDVLRAAGP